jgi:hypothetical protein
MKGKKVIWIVLLCFLMALGSFTAAKADTILFPVIAMGSPNVTTVVSVMVRPGSTSSHLHYIYSVKDAMVSGSPNITGSCTKVQFTRTNFDSDVLSFDATGIFNSGNALFGDTDSYGGGFSLSGTGDRRAYLLVTNASDSSGTRVDVGNNQDLGGEAILMEIGFGAAWGMRGINDITREDYTFINVDDGGGIWSALPSNGFTNRRFTFFPPNEWTTRFFVTPIGSNMNSSDNTATVNLYSSAAGGVYDRMGTQYTFTPIDQSVTCTAAIDLEDLMDSTTWAALQTTGGFSWIRVASGDAIIYKLEYVLENSTYGGTNNNGYLLSTFDLP